MEILVVEDDPFQFQLLHALLETEGYAVRCAATGMAAMHLAREHLPALILLDASLPDISGFQVARDLKGDAATGRIPIAMLSADASRADLERAAAYGCEDYFTKPIDMRTFAAEVARLIALGGAPRVE
jgi:two-component system phosphate regulon response regulator PhoB